MAFWYDKNLGTLENTSSGHSILKEQKLLNHFFRFMKEID